MEVEYKNYDHLTHRVISIYQVKLLNVIFNFTLDTNTNME